MQENLGRSTADQQDDLDAICRAIDLHPNPLRARDRVLELLSQGTPVEAIARLARADASQSVDSCEMTSAVS